MSYLCAIRPRWSRGTLAESNRPTGRVAIEACSARSGRDTADSPKAAAGADAVRGSDGFHEERCDTSTRSGGRCRRKQSRYWTGRIPTDV